MVAFCTGLLMRELNGWSSERARAHLELEQQGGLQRGDHQVQGGAPHCEAQVHGAQLRPPDLPQQKSFHVTLRNGLDTNPRAHGDGDAAYLNLRHATVRTPVRALKKVHFSR